MFELKFVFEMEKKLYLLTPSNSSQRQSGWNEVGKRGNDEKPRSKLRSEYFRWFEFLIICSTSAYNEWPKDTLDWARVSKMRTTLLTEKLTEIVNLRFRMNLPRLADHFCKDKWKKLRRIADNINHHIIAKHSQNYSKAKLTVWLWWFSKNVLNARACVVSVRLSRFFFYQLSLCVSFAHQCLQWETCAGKVTPNIGLVA